MGPGFGEEIGRSMALGAVLLLVVGILIGIGGWELLKWISAHLSVAWR